MTNATAQTLENGFALRSGRKASRTAVFAGAALAALALVPVAVATFGILRGGVEPYMVLAALVLG